MAFKIDTLSFRKALSAYATGVTVITTLDAAGQKVGMTASSFTSLSLDPPLILWNIDKNTGCFDAFYTCKHFAVHVLQKHQADVSEHFAGRGFDKFDTIASEEGLNGVPLLTDYAARFQCATEHRYEGGDHVILVGRVLEMTEKPSQPLIFCNGRYTSLKE